MKTIEFENDVIKNNLFDKNRKKTVDFISKSLGFINIKRKGGENEKNI